VAKPGGGYFLAETHQSGGARVHLFDASWGRQVDVFDVDEQGRTNPIPVLRDVVIGQGVQSDGSGLVLETSAITHEARLIVLRPRDAPDHGSGTFASVLARATGLLMPVVPKHDDGTSLPPFSLVARDSTLVLRFDDLLDDGPEARETLVETVRLTVGYPPVTPQTARIVYDPSHGGIANGEFHSTRVLIDFTVSEREAEELPGLPVINAAGLPASSTLSAQANVAVHLPSRIDETSGRFVRLVNLSARVSRPTGPSTRVAGSRAGLPLGNSGDANRAT
jgi:hypothetical protein